MTLVLAIDASCPRSVVCIGNRDTGELLAGEARVDGANQASRTLMQRIDTVLGKAKLVPGRLDAVACGVGPGTFTGTRVAISTIKGIALGLDVPVLALSTLAAVACSVGDVARDASDVLALLDARRGEVYAAALRLAPTPGEGPTGPRDDAWLLEPTCAKWASVCERLVSGATDLPSVRIIGPGVGAVEGIEDLGAASATAVPGPTPGGLWRAVCSGLVQHTTAREVDANYLRLSYAELGLNKPKRPVFRNPALDSD